MLTYTKIKKQQSAPKKLTPAIHAQASTTKTQSHAKSSAPVKDVVDELIHNPRLKALREKERSAFRDEDRTRLRAEIKKAEDEILNSPKPIQTSPSIVKDVKDDRLTYYWIGGEYLLMWYRQRAWFKRNSAAPWGWLIYPQTQMFEIKHLSVDDFKRVLRDAPTLDALESGGYRFQVHFPHSVELAGEDEQEFREMNVKWNYNDLRARIVNIDVPTGLAPAPKDE